MEPKRDSLNILSLDDSFEKKSVYRRKFDVRWYLSDLLYYRFIRIYSHIYQGLLMSLIGESSLRLIEFTNLRLIHLDALKNDW